MVRPFHSIYSQGFIRSAVCVPSLRVADPIYNVERTLGLARRASGHHAALVLFPELGLSAFSNEDLFHQDALLDAVLEALAELINESRNLSPVLLVGAPLRFQGKLFNCALVILKGKVLGIVPKTYLPNYREYYEKRQFVSARHALESEVRFQGQSVPFGNSLIFEAENLPGFALHVEICEDMWVPISPSTYGALAGATVLAKPVRQQHHRGQDGLPTPPLCIPVGQVHFSLSVFRCRLRGIHHGSGLGRACHDL